MTEQRMTITPEALAAMQQRNADRMAHRWVEAGEVRPFDVIPVSSSYVEHYWLPTIGPSATWLWRRLVAWLVEEPAGFMLDLDECAHMLGMHGGTGNTSTMNRTLVRLTQFHLADDEGWTLRVRTALPALTAKQLARLPERLRSAHNAPVSAVPSTHLNH